MRVSFVSKEGLVPDRSGHVTSREFARARNLIVRACASHGTVGPLGQEPPAPAETISDDPDFYVIDDHYGDDRWITIEPKLEAITTDWLNGLADALAKAPRWEALVKPGESIFLVVGPKTIRIAGWAARSRDPEKIAEELRGYLHAMRVKTAATRQARVEDLRRYLPEAWPSDNPGVGFVASFPTHSDGTIGESVWLLHFDDEYGLDLDKYSFEPEALRLSLYWASRTGSITQYAPANRPKGPDVALLAEWILVKAGKPMIRALRLRVTKGTKRWDFALASH